MTNRLIVLPPSHYCERARWALDTMDVAYVEERWPVGPHVGMAKKLAPKSSLPILVADGTVIQGSGAILDWTGMPGGDPALEDRFCDRMAVLVRQMVYAATLHDPDSGIPAVLFDGVSGPQAWVARAIWPVTRKRMARFMDAHPEALPTIFAKIEAELEWLGGLVADREHLVGDRFGRADLTAASLTYPLFRDRSTGPAPRLPPDVTQVLAQWRQTPAARWVCGIYARYRTGLYASTAVSSDSLRQAPAE